MRLRCAASIFFLALFFVACGQNNSSSVSGAASTTISANEFQKAITANAAAQIVDVRTAPEYNGGHIKNAMQANWNNEAEFTDRTQYLDKSKPVYVYCQAGGRSAAAQQFLASKGYTVINLEGGMSNWKMNQLPVEGASNVPQMRVEDYDQVIKSNNVVLVDIGAEWCPPCRKMLPVVDKVKAQFSKNLYFLAVNGGNDYQVMEHVQFQALPTFIVYKNGKEVWRKQGIVDEAEFVKAIQ
jgi:rhodanese-related sulfurtransferase